MYYFQEQQPGTGPHLLRMRPHSASTYGVILARLLKSCMCPVNVRKTAKPLSPLKNELPNPSLPTASPVEDAPPQRQHLRRDLGQVVEAAKCDEAIRGSRQRRHGRGIWRWRVAEEAARQAHQLFCERLRDAKDQKPGIGSDTTVRCHTTVNGFC